MFLPPVYISIVITRNKIVLSNLAALRKVELFRFHFTATIFLNENFVIGERVFNSRKLIFKFFLFHSYLI